MNTDPSDFTILGFIVDNGFKPGDKLPTLQQISEDSGISIAKVREALEVARVMGLVEIRPGRGTHVAPLQVTEAVKLAASYMIGIDDQQFFALRELRNALEGHYWEEATKRLVERDINHLRGLVTAAFKALETSPIQIPSREHREFHLTIYSRLDNLFVSGILEAFWDVYDAFGYSLYQELHYHKTVWAYHEKMVDAIAEGNSEKGKSLLLQHMALLSDRKAQPANDTRSFKPSIFE